MLAAILAIAIGASVPPGLGGATPSRPQRAQRATDRFVSFEQRVEAQRAIEQVYWRHREWPEQNAASKPPLSMSEAALRAKVEDTLRKSSALEAIWDRPVTAEQLQGEMDRMAAHTRDRRMLDELFDALGNDPTLIAETLARASLVDRLVREEFATDRSLHAEARRRADAATARCGNASCMLSMGGDYLETVWLAPGAPDEGLDERAVRMEPEEWRQQRQRLAGRRNAVEETADAFVVTAILAESEQRITTATVAWKKPAFDAWWSARSTGFPVRVPAALAPFSPAAVTAAGCTFDTWSPTSTGPGDPEPRHYQASVWTGRR